MEKATEFSYCILEVSMHICVIQQLDMSCMHETVGYWYLQCLLLGNRGRVWASIKSGLPLTMLIWLSSRVAFIVRPRVRCLASCCISTKGHFKYRTHVIICREKHSWLAHLMTSAMHGLAVFKAIEHKKKKNSHRSMFRKSIIATYYSHYLAVEATICTHCRRYFYSCNF